jgi:hypothetical protein
MKIFDSTPEPWAKVVALVGTFGFGVLFYFWIDAYFGIGVACGAVIYMILHWGLRLDERPFWQHIFGRPAVYPEDRQRHET